MGMRKKYWNTSKNLFLVDWSENYEAFFNFKVHSQPLLKNFKRENLEEWFQLRVHLEPT